MLYAIVFYCKVFYATVEVFVATVLFAKQNDVVNGDEEPKRLPPNVNANAGPDPACQDPRFLAVTL